MSETCELLVSFACKSALILAVVAAVDLVLRRLRTSTAETRHWLWSIALSSILLLPIMTFALPPHPTTWIPSSAQPPTALSILEQMSVSTLGVGDTGIAEDTSSTAVGLDISSVLVSVWLAGVALLLARLAAQLWILKRITHRARPLDARELARPRLPAGVDVRSSSEIGVPVCHGLLHSVVLFPESFESWSATRRRVVLDHELAHVSRLDYLANLVANVACALSWFNPIAWYALRRHRLERELACDDCVLRHGTRDVDYATHLLGIARGMTPGGVVLTAGVVGMAGRPELELRIRAILDPSLARGRAAGTSRLGIAAIVIALTAPLAAVQPDDAMSRWRTESSLVADLRSDLPFARENGLLALGARAQRKTFRHIVPLVRDPEPSVRAAALWALGEIGCDPAFVTIAHSLSDSDPLVRRMAATRLIGFPAALVHRPLRRVLYDYSPHTARLVEEHIGGASMDTALERLGVAAQDPDAAVRTAARHAQILFTRP